ncbi:hypothetical protein Pelo_7683 [Pelomyxa schiedti]|nr:hypothetical protein Pelo_7683 [Pelomyxa schiedti]
MEIDLFAEEVRVSSCRNELAFVTGTHPRCGSNSHVKLLSVYILQWIVEYTTAPSMRGCMRALHRGQLGYFHCQINNRGHAALVSIGPLGATWEDFVKSLPPTQCLLSLANMTLSRSVQRMYYVSWTPDDAPVRQKVSCAALTNAFIRGLVCGGYLPKQVQASSAQQLVDLFQSETVLYEKRRRDEGLL